jgi:hypothetical protein
MRQFMLRIISNAPKSKVVSLITEVDPLEWREYQRKP